MNNQILEPDEELYPIEVGTLQIPMSLMPFFQQQQTASNLAVGDFISQLVTNALRAARSQDDDGTFDGFLKSRGFD